METLKQCYDEAKELLSGNREVMDKLAAHLIEKETISGKEFMKIYRQEKGIPEPEEENKDQGSEKPGQKELTESSSSDAGQSEKEEANGVPGDNLVAAQENQDDEKLAKEEAADAAGAIGNTAKEKQEDDRKQPENAQGNQSGTTGRFSNASSDFFD